MNGEEFYLAFKDALQFLDLKWGQKEMAIVTVVGSVVHVKRGSLGVTIDVSEPKDLTDS